MTNEIALKLMDYGFDFNYENRGSGGETIQEHMIPLRISTAQGKIYFHYQADMEIFEDNEESFNKLVNLIEKILIEETN